MIVGKSMKAKRQLAEHLVDECTWYREKIVHFSMSGFHICLSLIYPITTQAYQLQKF